jgi:lipopolysaccharide heptosyltransferase II
MKRRSRLRRRTDPIRILLVRLRLIGDVVFTTPVIRALRRQYPAATITYVVEAEAAPVVARNPHLTEVIAIARARGFERLREDWRIGRRLRAARFDLVVDLHGGPRSAWLAWATRAPVRVGYDVAGRAWMYSRVVHRPRRLLPRHSVLSQWDLLPAVDAAFPPTPDRSADRVEMPVDPAAAARVAGQLAHADIPTTGRLIVIHVSAGNPFRRWPEAAFAELASGLVGEAADRWVLLTGGPSDRAATTRVLGAARARAGGAAARLLDAEDWSLADLRAVCDRAALYIGGDSGPLHIASTSDVPIVGLYGPTLPERSAPWRPDSIRTASVDVGALPCRPCDQRVCAPGDFRCLRGLGAGAVRTAAERLLAP